MHKELANWLFLKLGEESPHGGPRLLTNDLNDLAHGHPSHPPEFFKRIEISAERLAALRMIARIARAFARWSDGRTSLDEAARMFRFDDFDAIRRERKRVAAALRARRYRAHQHEKLEV